MASQSNSNTAKLEELSKEIIKIEYDLGARIRDHIEKVVAAGIELKKVEKHLEEAGARVKAALASLEARGYIVKDEEVYGHHGGEAK